MTSQKLIKTILAGLMVFSVAATTTACGNRQVTNLPPTEDELPKDIGTITVTVIDNNSKPVEGATVTLAGQKGPVGEPALSGPDGIATFTKVPLGSGYAVTAEDGGVTGSQAGLGIDGEAPLVVRVMLIPANASKGTVGGTIVNGLSGQPLEGATVSVLGTQNTVTTRADGSFVLKDVPAGNPTVVAVAKSFREARLNVALKAGKLETSQLRLFPIAGTARVGNTVITTSKSILEVDKFLNPVKNTSRGATQARLQENGNLLVANSAGVVELNDDNMVIWSYRPMLLGRLGNPQGVARTKSGNVLIADTDNDRVVEVSPNHKVEKTLKVRFNHPMSVDRIDATNTTLVADAGNHRIVEVADNGVIVWSVGNGTPALLNHPAYATRLPNGNTLIADTGNSRVMEINKAQQLVWMYGGKGDKATCHLPNSAVRLANGNTLIADTGNDRVIEVSAKGELVWQMPGVEQPLFAERL